MLPAHSIGDFVPRARSIVDGIGNSRTRLMYQKALEDFHHWWQSRPELIFSRALVLEHREYLASKKYSPATINQRLSAIRKVVGRAADEGWLGLSTAVEVIRIANLSYESRSIRPALSAVQTEALINAPEQTNNKGIRDRALLAVLVGCALRSRELVKLSVNEIQNRESHWMLMNVGAERGRARNVAIPEWARQAIEAWIQVAKLRYGAVFRAVDRSGKISTRAISADSVLPIVAFYGRAVGLEVKPFDLRRTCAELCRLQGGTIEQIQLLLGHANIQTTARYVEPKEQTVAPAPNERVHMRWHDQKIAS